MVFLRIYMFSKQQRFRLGICFSIFNIIQVLLGAITTGWSVYVVTIISPNLYTEKPEIDFVFTVTGMYGMFVVLHYLVGMKICEKCIYKAHKKSTKRHLLFWCLVGCNTILNIIILAVVSVKIYKHIGKSMRHSLEKGIQNYLGSAKWKRTIDIWQYKLQCCGVDDYNDWYQLSWMDKYHIDVNNRISQSLRLSQEKLHFPVVPWSCCRIKFPMQCLHDPLQQAQSAHLWKEQPKLVVESINTDGCLNKLRAPIRLSMIGFLIICIFLIILQVGIIIVSRLLYTSAKNAIILRDPEGESPGYLLTRGCTGQAKKTVSELVLTIQSSKDKTYDFEEKPSVKKSGLNKFISKPSIPKVFPKRLKKKKKDNNKKGHDSNEDPVSTEDEEALMLR